MTNPQITKASSAIQNGASQDDKLIAACCEVQQLDMAIAALFDKLEDPCERREYRDLENRRLAAIEILATTPAQSREGIIAKAKALGHRMLAEDPDRHVEVGMSLADDVLRYLKIDARDEAAAYSD
jgi:hypothetical protein